MGSECQAATEATKRYLLLASTNQQTLKSAIMQPNHKDFWGQPFRIWRTWNQPQTKNPWYLLNTEQRTRNTKLRKLNSRIFQILLLKLTTKKTSFTKTNSRRWDKTKRLWTDPKWEEDFTSPSTALSLNLRKYIESKKTGPSGTTTRTSHKLK